MWPVGQPHLKKKKKNVITNINFLREFFFCKNEQKKIPSCYLFTYLGAPPETEFCFSLASKFVDGCKGYTFCYLSLTRPIVEMRV